MRAPGASGQQSKFYICCCLRQINVACCLIAVTSCRRAGSEAGMTAATVPGLVRAPPPVPAMSRRDAAGSSSARGLMFTILGEYVLPAGGHAWTSTLIETMAGPRVRGEDHPAGAHAHGGRRLADRRAPRAADQVAAHAGCATASSPREPSGSTNSAPTGTTGMAAGCSCWPGPPNPIARRVTSCAAG